MPGPFGATPGGARHLALDVAAEGTRPGQRAPRVSDETLSGWLEQGGSQVALRLPRLGMLPANEQDAAAFPGVPDQETVTKSARLLVELYGASLLADVTHPERIRGTDGGYGAVLYSRYEKGLDELAIAVDEGVDRMADVNAAAPGMQAGDAEGVFPLAAFTRVTGF